MRGTPWRLAVPFLAGLQLSACTYTPDAASQSEPAKVERVQGTDLSRVILSAKAAERLAIKTDPVRRVRVTGAGHPTERTVVPHAAMLYDAHGNVWTYTNPEPLVFVRQRISVDSVQGDLAVLSDGPPAGTRVVTVGAAELFGIEVGLGK